MNQEVMNLEIEKQIESAIQELYTNEQCKLKQICNKEMMKFGGLSQKDYDDFYSRAGKEIALAKHNKKYDPSKGKSPLEFFIAIIKRAVWKEMTDRNRGKRQLTIESEEKDEKGNIIKKKKYIPTISIDSPIDDNSDTAIIDTLQSNFNINNEIFKHIEDYEECINEFMKNLSDMQKDIVLLIMKGYEKNDIKTMLNITDKQYKNCWSVITSYEKKRILYKKDNDMEDKIMDTMIIKENVTEKYKNTSYSIASISKQLKRKRLRDDHILQRHSGQWRSFAKSELVSDVLRGKSLTQIIISEEIKNGIKMQWLIDGKQRCTTLDDYLHDGFSISKNVKNYNITYQAPKTDENGNEILNEDGFVDMEWKYFDIRGKKFSQLPEELQDIFKDRQIPVLYNMNCTKKDIADDIARFNRSRPMNKAQNGWLGLEEDFAEFVEKIAKMQFFQPEFLGSTYTGNTSTSGATRRIIVESIMVSDFIDNFGDFGEMCEFLTNEASDSNFTEFYALVERLTLICNTENIASLFNTKDSFLWFGLFSRFTKLDIDDNNFADFMNNFEILRAVKVDGKSFDDILSESKATKDKSIVIKKMNHLYTLMKEYLNDTKRSDILDSALEYFISDNLNIDTMEIHNNINFYKETLDKLLSDTIKEGSKLLNKQNYLSLLMMVIYSYKENVDLYEWLVKYSQNNNTYFMNQKKNFLHMKNDFEKFCEEYKLTA